MSPVPLPLLLLALLPSAACYSVFIDGSAGTTGLQVRERLAGRADLTVIEPPASLRKDPATRRAFLNKADAAILCLPDSASREAARWLDEDGNAGTVLVDASTAFRTDPSFAYGLPELSPAHREKLRTSTRISNPGCYPTGFISLLAPLVAGGLVPPSLPATVNAVSGYSGGGKPLIQLYEGGEECEPYGAYGFELSHKHMPEMALYAGLEREPLFQPAVGNFPQGMLVNVPLHYSQLAPGVTGARLAECLQQHYEGEPFVSVSAANSKSSFERGAFLRPDSLANTNKLELFVNHNDDNGLVVLTARLDNLGKGASGAAVQNLNLALGLDETAGLL